MCVQLLVNQSKERFFSFFFSRWVRGYVVGAMPDDAREQARAAVTPSSTLCACYCEVVRVRRDGLLREAATEAGQLAHLAWPQTVTSVMQFSPRLFLLFVVGHLPNGAVLVGAAGIGSMFANFSQLMLIRSSTFGAVPLFAQAFGAGNHHRVGVVLMRVLFLHALLALCFSLPLTAFAGPLLAAVGQPAAVAAHAQTFIWLRLLGLPGLILSLDVTSFLTAQRCVRLPMYVGMAGALAQVCLSFTLTRALGFVGAPLAMSLVELLMGATLFLVAPVLLRRHKIRSWPRWCVERRQATRGWGEIAAKGGKRRGDRTPDEGSRS